MSRAVEINDVAAELWDALSDASALGSDTKTALLTTLGLDTDLGTFSLPASTTISSFGKTLVGDTDASAARNTLGLGTLATQNGTLSDYLPLAGGEMSGNLAFSSGTQVTLRNESQLVFQSGSIINISDSSTTPLDADFLPVATAASSNSVKKLTLANLKATVKTYFDTLYMLVTGLDGVMVTKATGTRRCYVASADTDTARGLALEAAFAAAVAGDTIDLSPGNYYVAKATSTISFITGQYAILNGMTIRLNGARLYKKSTDTASCMFVVNAANGIDDWSIIGPGTLDGSYAANSDTTARGTAAAEIGINVTASRRCKITNLTIKNMAGTGLQCNSATFAVDGYGSLKVSTGSVLGCNFDLNNIGMANYSGNEYWSFSGCTFNKNLTGADVYAGNTKFLGCEINGNTNHGIRIRNGGNDGHGCFVGGMMNHNSGFAIAAEASMDLGFTFTGSHFFADSNTTNKIQSLGGGLNFTGCIIDSPIYASGTPTGINTIKDTFISGTYTVITDLSAAERAKWKFVNNHTLTGVWASDDIRTTYATDAAAGAGGVLQGELWQQTTTGAVFVKL